MCPNSVIPRGDPDSLASATSPLLQSFREANEIGQRALPLARDRFTIDATARS
jgi:hypothetical protein